MKKHIKDLSGYLIIFSILFGLFLLRQKEKKEEELWKRVQSLTPKLEKAIYDRNTGKPFNGLHEKFYQNGKLSSQVEYSNGVRNGMDKAWWEDGKPKHILNYKNGSKDGRFEYYNSNGVLLRAGFHENNKKSGLWEGWYDSGNLHYSANYVEGFLDGKMTYFYPNRQKMLEFIYKNGELDSSLSKKRWNEDGSERTKPFDWIE